MLRSFLVAATLLQITASVCSAQRADSLDEAAQRRIVDRVAELLIERYVFPETARQVAAALRHETAEGQHFSSTDPATFASALSARLRDLSGDAHLWLVFDPDTYFQPEPDSAARAEAAATQRRQLATSNFGFQRVELLPGNIGYLNIRQFTTPALGGDKLAAAMMFLSDAEWIVLDLRESTGGSSAMVALIASYFLGPDPVSLFEIHHRVAGTSQRFESAAELPAPRLLDQPLFVLTRNSTFSAGEGLAYVLKHMRGATIVGETTGGGANPGAYHRLDENFVMFIAEAQVRVSATGSNWEGSGVAPHVEVQADDALNAALDLIRSRQGS